MTHGRNRRVFKGAECRKTEERGRVEFRIRIPESRVRHIFSPEAVREANKGAKSGQGKDTV